MAAFEQYCVPRTNESVCRHLFFTRSQREGETFDLFLTDLKKLSVDCAFDSLKDSLIRDRIISGIRDKSLKDRLLRETNLDLGKCVKMCKSTELANMQLKILHGEKTIDEVRIKRSGDSRRKRTETFKEPFKSGYSREQDGGRKPYKNELGNKSSSSNWRQHDVSAHMKPCGRCGSKHPRLKCPAYNKLCNVCHKRNHFAKMCRDKLVHIVEDEQRSGEMEEVSMQTLYLNTVSSNIGSNEWFEKLKLENNEIIYAKLDTGAQCNAVSIHKYRTLNVMSKMLGKPNVRLKNFNGSTINVVGRCEIICQLQNQIKHAIEFYLVDTNTHTPIVLGLPTIENLKLLQRVDEIKQDEIPLQRIIDNYKVLFKGIGKINNYKYKIQLKPDAIGKIEMPRKIPLKVQTFLKTELEVLSRAGIIKRVNEPTDWVSSLVVTKKKSDNKYRMCIDPQHLNKQILREHFMLPTFEEITAKVKGAQIYSILDANKAFWQVELSEDSTRYTTFNTPYGRFCFQRLPYGLCSAPEVFHKCFSEIFGDIEGVAIYIDDILIWGANEHEHKLRLQQVLERAKLRNVKFNKLKCKIGVREIKYLGHILTPEGILPDPDKVQGIQKIKCPENKKELLKFLGMITYVSKFLPNLSQLTTKLRELVKKNAAWHWNEQHIQAFDQLKKTLTEAPVLQYFDERAHITLSVDASKDGLGAVLLQNDLPVAYASRALTDIQKGYAQIEKEMLAIQYGCERFHQYIFGKTVSVETDHRPLEFIFNKPLNKCPLRLQLMRIKLQLYDIVVKYKPGKMLLLADALSRTTSGDGLDSCEDQDSEVEAYVSEIVQEMPISNKKLQEFLRETQRDKELQTVIGLVKQGWPKQRKQVPEEARLFHNYESELSIIGGLLFKNETLVVPRTMRKELLQIIHYNHLGVHKCKNRARNVVFWPNMNKEIEDLVGNCTTCQRFQKKQRRQPMLERELPHGPWQHLGADIFYYKGKDFLLVVDMFSKFVEIEKLADMSSHSTIEALKKIIARYGIPNLIFSDNGPQFSSMQFKQFTNEYGIEHRTSSPGFPQSNGLAERYIQTVKQMWRKADFENKDPHLVILEYNSTPLTGAESPSDLMFNRTVRSLLPKKTQLFATINNKQRMYLYKNQQVNKSFYDRRAGNLKDVQIGDNVFIASDIKDHELIEAKIIAKNDGPRSYKLLTQKGTVVGRNRRDIYKNASKTPLQIDRDYHDYSTLAEPEIKQVIKPTTVTRSGRESRPLRYLEDYVT